MGKRIGIVFASILFVALTVMVLHFNVTSAKTTGAARQAQDDSIDCALSSFNDSVQERFKVVDRYFGYRRIIRPDDSAHNFKPDKAKEIKDVGDLKAAHLTVALYLTSRGVLADPPKEEAASDKNVYPLFLSPNSV